MITLQKSNTRILNAGSNHAQGVLEVCTDSFNFFLFVFILFLEYENTQKIKEILKYNKIILALRNLQIGMSFQQLILASET